MSENKPTMGTVLDERVGGEYCHQQFFLTSPPESWPQLKKITRTRVTLQLSTSAFLYRACAVNMVLSQIITQTQDSSFKAIRITILIMQKCIHMHRYT